MTESGWAAKRAALIEQWSEQGLAPMTASELYGAVARDKGEQDFGVNRAAYDRRGLLNLVAALLAIEAEAAASVRAELAEKVRALVSPDDVWPVNDRQYGWQTCRTTVLAILDAATELPTQASDS